MAIEKALKDKREDILRIASMYGGQDVRVFGSLARGEAGPNSDVDILVEFDRPTGLFGFVRLQRYLEELLGRDVDLATPAALRADTRSAILAEAIHAA